MADETCTIRCAITRRGNFTTHRCFQAEREDGEVLERSEVFHAEYHGVHRHNPEHAAAYEALLASLKRAGWEESGQGEQWFEVQLRRSETAG